jgi:hypothetical protein
MTTWRSLLDVPPQFWTYDDVHDFLQARTSENDRIEYKADFTDNIVDTVVSMANGDGGLIFVGVSEVTGQKIPKAWPLLPPGKDPAGTV